MVRFAELKNDLALGSIQPSDFIVESKKLFSNIEGSVNDICIAINVHFYELLNIKALRAIPEGFIQDIESLFKKIEKLPADDKINPLLNIWNAENLMILIGSYRQKIFGELNVRNALGADFSMAEKKERLLFLANLNNELTKIMIQADKIANDTGNGLLKAHIIKLRSRNIIATEIDFIAFGFHNKVSIPENHRTWINHIQLSLIGYQNFLENSYFKEAYQSLCNTLELYHIAVEAYHFSSDIDLNRLLIIKSEMEKQLDIAVYSLVIPPLIQRSKNNDNSGNGMSLKSLQNLDDYQLENLANQFLAAFRLPKDRLVNILNELKAYRLFYSRKADDTLEVFQLRDLDDNGHNAYSIPVRFVLKSKESGLESQESSDMEFLLKFWGK